MASFKLLCSFNIPTLQKYVHKLPLYSALDVVKYLVALS